MRTDTPSPEYLADHTGRPRAVLRMPLAYEQARMGLAFHEAGHTVLLMSYGMHVLHSEVTAWTEGDDWFVTGNTQWGVPDGAEVSPWHIAAQAAAGEIAHCHYLMTHGLWTPERAAACASDHDREQAVDLLASAGYRLGRDHVPDGGKSWGQAQGMARRKVVRLWPQISTVARAMTAQGRLTGAEIATLTGLPGEQASRRRLVNHPGGAGEAA
ncbi:hypothetical protein ACFV3R_06650 [Streptomyces sp. NPDC059740]|uniref:hypothetical protein n=1 Tax=Streptomyces sp. NPDC059740 TaxID=3346926 RepID=UPI0036696DBA